jgi:hypothetical protein
MTTFILLTLTSGCGFLFGIYIAKRIKNHFK